MGYHDTERATLGTPDQPEDERASEWKSTSATSALFDYELLAEYANSRRSGALAMPGLLLILALFASLYVPPLAATLWVSIVIIAHVALMIICGRFELASVTGYDANRWASVFIYAEAVYGISWSTLSLFTLVSDDPSVSIVMFAMVLVGIAANATSTRTLPGAALMSTLPATMAVTINLMTQGGLLNWSLAAVITGGEIFFVYLAKQLHRSELETIHFQGEKDALIMELDAARLHAEQANAAKSQFLATMSHELRTPLNGILGNVQLLMRTKSAADKDFSVLADMEMSGDHLLSLITDLLDISRIEAGTYVLNETWVSLADIAADSHDMVSVRARAKNISLSIVRDTHLAAVLLDERAIRQAVLNLLSNAIKFTDAGGTILVSITGRKDGGQSISVRDTGIGMDTDEQQRAMAGGASASISPDLGTGLGLRIAQRMTALHDGSFDLFSKKGFGTEVVISLPPSRTKGRNPIQVQSSDARPVRGDQVNFMGSGRQETSLRILVVEDDPASLRLMSAILASAGHQVVTADTGQAALAALTGQVFDSVLLDINLPGMLGTDVKQQFDIATDTSKRPAFIAVTANAFLSDRERYLADGFAQVLSKPVSPDAVLAAVSSVTRLSDTLDTLWYPAAFERHVITGIESKVSAEDFISMIQDLRMSLETCEAHLRDALSTRDRIAARKLAHRVKGTAGTFGLLKLHLAAAELEALLADETAMERAGLAATMNTQLADSTVAVWDLFNQRTGVAT